MNIISKLLSVILLGAAVAGCATQKQVLQSDSAAGELHRQAQQALDERRFTIEATEVYPTSGAAPVSAFDTYITMNDKHAVMRISPDVFPHLMRSNRQTEDYAAEMANEKSKKNGDKQYRLKIEGEKMSWMSGEMLITLYNGTNKCLVQILPGKRSSMIHSFRGQVQPSVNK